MKYTGPKFKLCRREGINLFGSAKYDTKKRRGLPGQHGANMPRLSEYGKLLRNKQVLKRTYLLSEKQFSRIVNVIASKYAKNKGQDHDKTVVQFLERRLDAIILRSGLAKSIMQARQMVTHCHVLLNGVKHNIPSYFVEAGDVITVKPGLQSSPLYADYDKTVQLPSRLKYDVSKKEITVLSLPNAEEIKSPADILKVVEYYARA